MSAAKKADAVDPCAICCEAFNRRERQPICCPFCAFTACRTCCETYLMNEPRPVCMQPNCDKEWSRKFLREMFTNTFLTKRFRPHLERLMFEQEKALLPATQPLVIERLETQRFNNELNEINRQIQELLVRRRTLQEQMWRRHRQLRQAAGRAMLGEGGGEGGDGDTEGSGQEKKQFVRQCPNNECRGFLSMQWKCGMCNLWACSKCHEVKGPEKDSAHTCDPNNVETAKMLEKDSRPCPQCQSLIFRISGCDQMFCTICQTAFSWRTGKVMTGAIHNPHYFEWQRQQAALRNGGAVQEHQQQQPMPRIHWQNGLCGGDEHQLNHMMIDAAWRFFARHSNLRVDPSTTSDNESVDMGRYSLTQRNRMRSADRHVVWQPEAQQLIQIMRHMIHNQEVVTRQFPIPNNPRQANLELRIKYLMKEITEEAFKVAVQRADKKMRKHMELRQVLDLCSTAVRDTCARILENLEHAPPNEHQLVPMLAELQEVRRFCNGILREVAFTYTTSVMYQFDEQFQWTQTTPVKPEYLLAAKSSSSANATATEDDASSTAMQESDVESEISTTVTQKKPRRSVKKVV